MPSYSSENVCIVCINVAFANAAALQNALNCNIAIQLPEKKGYGKYLTKEPYNIEKIPDSPHYIFAGSGILTRIDLSRLEGRKTVIISDSHYLQETSKIDALIEKYKIEVFCMADLWQYCKFPKKMYIHPFVDFDYMDFSHIKKRDKFTICHSPYHKVETNQKGSREIEQAVKKLKYVTALDYECITDKTWRQTLDIKASCHFFIDQISEGNHFPQMGYKGGLGKSGLEAMLLGCLTFCGGDKIVSDVPAAPFIQVDNESLCKKLLHYKENPFSAQTIQGKQLSWAKKYTNNKYVAKKILDEL